MMYEWNFSDIARQINELQYGPYVPPCERHPYYDDPRDVKPSWEPFIPKQNPYSFCGWDTSQNQDQTATVNLVRCQKCGTYFQSSGMIMFCEECRKSQ